MNKTNLFEEHEDDDSFYQFLFNNFKKVVAEDIHNPNCVNDHSFYQRMFRTFIQNAPIGMFILENSAFSYVNHRFLDFLGFSVKEIVLQENFIRQLIHPEDFSIVQESIRKKMENEATSGRYRVRALKKNTEVIYVEIHSMKVELNEKTFIFGSVINVTEEVLANIKMVDIIEQSREQNLKIERLAHYDSLTNLPNRKLFEERLQQALVFSNDHHAEIAVLFLDLDRFKFVNDSLGHQAGDHLLRLVAERLKENLRDSDTLSRFGGDEFTILLPHTTKEQTITFTERIISILSKPFDIQGHPISTTASIGIAFSSRNTGATVTELIKKADSAMYISKKLGKNNYIIYTKEIEKEDKFRLILEGGLSSALENHEFLLNYQPIVDLKTGQINAVEALIRWNHPQLGMIAPNDFISIAEESGHINSLGKWALQTACLQNKKWQKLGAPLFKISVNISVIQLQHPQFVATVRQILESTGLEAKWLDLEITESNLMGATDSIKDTFIELKELGVSMSIDDFGTGYTSLSYLRLFAFDKVKIDRSFINEIEKDTNGKKITSSIISLAHNLNLKVVAEGVETKDQLSYLMDEFCDEGQGFYFSYPGPAHSLPAVINN